MAREINALWRGANQIIAFVGAILISGSALSNPVLNDVASGQVSIEQTSSQVIVNQTSGKAILNWKTFNIKEGEHTHFNQPAGGTALNRIDPNQGASQIYGRLTATGQIILINGAGLHFGPNAYVNVGSLIAGTADISNQNFLNGIYQFSMGSMQNGSVVNEGQIIAAQHGLVALVGSSVTNSGLIQAELGQVVLGSGRTFTMNFAGNDLVGFSVDEGALSAGVDKDGNPISHGVSNTGKIIANGGKIHISAKTASSILDNAINLKGIAQAQSVGAKNGEIILMAHGGTAKVSGRLDVSGKNIGEKGGKVKVLGNKVAVYQEGVIDASGHQGGGEVLIGGNYKGSGPEQNAQYAYVGTSALIDASALTNGNGGRVILWSDEGTKFYGTIKATGGS